MQEFVKWDETRRQTKLCQGTVCLLDDFWKDINFNMGFFSMGSNSSNSNWECGGSCELRGEISGKQWVGVFYHRKNNLVLFQSAFRRVVGWILRLRWCSLDVTRVYPLHHLVFFTTTAWILNSRLSLDNLHVIKLSSKTFGSSYPHSLICRLAWNKLVVGII